MSQRVKPPRSPRGKARKRTASGGGQPAPPPRAARARGDREAGRDKTETVEKSARQAVPTIDEFFAGVAAMRAHLDRHSRDPQRRRARLARIAEELLQHREGSGLGTWLVGELRDAVGAQACTLLRRDTAWEPWHRAGESTRMPEAATLESLSAPVASKNGDLLLPVPGVEGLFGALWFELGQELDAASRALLSALAGAAGMVLEQVLRSQALRTDPVTGLLAQAAFLDTAEQARANLAAVLVAAFRVAGMEAIRQAYGLRATQAAMARLGAAVTRYFPAKVVGVHFDVVLALLPAEAAPLDVTAYLTAINAALRSDGTEGGAALSASVVYLTIRAGEDLAAAVDRLVLQVAQVQDGAVRL